MNEPILTVVGNLAGDPELRFTPSGKAVCGFTVASTPRVKNGDQWEDGETTWLRCSAWDAMAENVAESLEKGNRVIVQGALSSRSYETREGEKRTSLELRVDAVGPDLRFATARATRAGQSGGGRPAQQQKQAGDPWARPGQSDPWATPNADDAPPF